jgi:Flp pilus assembly protein TadG
MQINWMRLPEMKAMRKIISRIHDQTGASAVEFAIILPLLVLFVFGIIEFSIMFYDKAVITNASREGARAGVVFADPRLGVAEIQNIVTNYVDTDGDGSIDRLITFGADDLQIDVPAPCEESGDELTVTVTYQYDFLIVPGILAAFFSGGAFADGTTIAARTKMRCE